jgi:hypothetical protein
MAGLVGNIALGGSKRRRGGMPSLLSLAETGSGARVWRGNARAAEVQGFGSLSSTRKSVETTVVAPVRNASNPRRQTKVL